MPKFHVTRSIELEADPNKVFEAVADFGKWPTWSPWLLAEPDAKLEFGEKLDERGGWYSWDGEIVGAGKMTHLELSAPGPSGSGFIRDRLNFLRPWKSEASVRMDFESVGASGTKLTWSMDSSVPIFLFFLKPILTSVIGMDYDRGLRMLKDLVDGGTIHSKTDTHGVKPVEGMTVAGLSKRCHLSEIGESMGKVMQTVKEKLTSAGMSEPQQWVSLYHDLNLKTQIMDFTTGVKIPADSEPPAGLVVKTVPPTQAFHVTHVGDYKHLGNAWFAAHQHLQATKRKANRKVPGVEIYSDGPETPAEERVTKLQIAVKS